MGGTADDDTIDYAKPLSTFEHGLPYDAVVTLYSWAQPMPWGIEELRYGFADATMSHVDEARLHRIVEWAYDRWQEGKSVLIRCQAGMNRSGLVCALVLMKAEYSAEDAIKLLREKRSEVVLFNDAFVDYLIGLETKD
jgi:protein-tyrosine phosphatase